MLNANKECVVTAGSEDIVRTVVTETQIVPYTEETGAKVLQEEEEVSGAERAGHIAVAVRNVVAEVAEEMDEEEEEGMDDPQIFATRAASGAGAEAAVSEGAYRWINTHIRLQPKEETS